MKRFLMVLGALAVFFFAVVAVGLGYVGYHAYTTADDNKKAAVAAVRILSEDWVPDDKQGILTVSLVRSAQTPNGKIALRQLAQLGKLVDVTKVSQTHFGIDSNEGTTATIEFEAKFTQGQCKVTVQLHKVGEVMKMYGVNTSETKFFRRKEMTKASL